MWWEKFRARMPPLRFLVHGRIAKISLAARLRQLGDVAVMRRAVDKPFDHGHNYMSAPIHGPGPVVE